MKKIAINLTPWIITIVALYYVCHDINWAELYEHVRNGNFSWLSLAISLTIFSYLMRSWRWLYFFPDKSLLNYLQSVKVLFLGFFMNNILPARTGELVRAHVGARLAKCKRTLVLATIASERLVDGVTISLFFLIFAVGSVRSDFSNNMLYVVSVFIFAIIGVILVLAFQKTIFKFINKIAEKYNYRYISYAVERVQIFIEGLKPLTELKRLPFTIFFSILIWSIELLVYYSVAQAFSANLSFVHCVIFMVTVNFSSLIPSAPGAIGVIEAIGTTVLVSLGVEKELALSLVLAQHIIQYLVVGVPGLIVMLSWRQMIKAVEAEQVEQNVTE
jgi:uncharacterized protein (TIRG00374 family)